MFINFTNHPSNKWGSKQLGEAMKWGEVVDVPFPNIGTEMNEKDIHTTAEKYVALISDMKPDVVLCQGEFTFVYTVVKMLKESGVEVVSACSERRVKERIDGNGISQKESIFEFVKFRRY